jgi:opacity protein-like surface antigen
MKKFLIVPALVAALAFPATASATSFDLAGNVNPSGTVSMTVKKRNGKYKVTNLAFVEIPITCHGTKYTSSPTSTSFVYKVNDKNKFGATLTNGSAFLKVHGKLSHHGKHAEGTVRNYGDGVLTNAGTQNNCDTGTLNWSADKI